MAALSGGYIPPPGPGSISVQSSCGAGGNGNGAGHAEVTITPAMPGTYVYTITRPDSTCGESVTAYDENGNELLRRTSGWGYCLSETIDSLGITYNNAFDLTLKGLIGSDQWVDTVMYPSTGYISIFPKPSCDGNWDNYTDPVTYTIVQGSEYALIYDDQGNNLGTTTTRTYSDPPIILKPTCTRPDGEQLIIVEAQSQNIISFDSLLIRSPGQMYLGFVSLSNDTILYPGMEVNANATVFNQEGKQWSPAPEGCITLDYEIIKGHQYGTLHEYRYNGQPDQEGDTLRNLPIDPAGWNVSVALRLWEEVPTKVETVQVCVKASDPTIKPDTVQFYIGVGLKVTANPAINSLWG